MSFADARRSSAVTGLPSSLRLRSLLALALAAAALLASTGIVANHLFHQPTTVKYLVTVIAPLLLAIACLVADPLRLVAGAAIITAPWDLNVTVSGHRLAPVTVLLALAAFIALLTPNERTSRATATGSVVAVALALLLPALALGRERPHYITWIATTLVAGWLAFQIAQQPGGLRFLLSLLVLAATFQGVVAIYEYAHHANLDLYSTEIKQTASQHYFFSFGSYFRPTGTLPDPDSLGNVLALACPLALVLALSASTHVRRVAWTVCALLLTIGLTLTFSRASWIGAAAGVIVVVIVMPARQRLAASAGIAALLVLTVLIGLSVGGADLRERFASIQNPTSRVYRTSAGDEDRKQIWSSALAIASAHPVFGTGMGRLQERLSEHLGASPEGLHAQSVYFQFLAEAGVAGLLALLLLVGHAVTGIIAGLPRERLLMAGVAGALVAVLVGWTTDTTARYTSVSVTIAFLFAAAMAQHAVAAGARRRARPAGLKLAGDPGLQT